MMQYDKYSPEWWQIVKNAGHWFSPSTMKFWGCEIIWSSLVKSSDGSWLFLSKDFTYDRSQKAFSIRKVESDGGISTVELQFAYDRREAIKRLKEVAA